MQGIRGIILEVLGRLACEKRGIDPDEWSYITDQYAWEFIAMLEIEGLRMEREARQRMENSA